MISVARVVVELSIGWVALWLSGVDLFTEGTEACKPTAKLVITRKQSKRRTSLIIRALAGGRSWPMAENHPSSLVLCPFGLSLPERKL